MLSTESTPHSFGLLQNYPNPFNPRTDIDFELRDRGLVTLLIVDVLGKGVATLVNGDLQPGKHRVSWDAGASPSGIYFAVLRQGNSSQMKKLVLTK
jgi:hypothetical protein